MTQEKTLSLAGTQDELVVQHRALAPIDQGDTRSEARVIHFQRLARRNKSTGDIGWEMLVDKLPLSQQTNDPFEVILPGFPLPFGSTWCLIGQKLSGNRLPIMIKYWRLDLETGDLIEVFPPHSPDASDREILSDGQTLLLRDATTQSLLAWTPDQGAHVIGGQGLSNSDNISVLSRRRILCVDHADSGPVVIRIVALDEDDVRRIFP